MILSRILPLDSTPQVMDLRVGIHKDLGGCCRGIVGGWGLGWGQFEWFRNSSRQSWFLFNLSSYYAAQCRRVFLGCVIPWKVQETFYFISFWVEILETQNLNLSILMLHTSSCSPDILNLLANYRKDGSRNWKGYLCERPKILQWQDILVLECK